MALCVASVSHCIILAYDVGLLDVAITVLPVSGMVGNYRRTKGKRKSGCIALHAVRFLLLTLATIRHGALPFIRSRIIAWRCPFAVRLPLGDDRWLDIMGIGQ
ncbi:hypothetical protein AAAY03_19690 [Bacteroides ovatus]|uniref:hypothetical protein n=1 Tax=Bacteroides TaxID=816 RepID=UPI00258D6710|nr:hypothetical protein [Bacteroides sp.]